MRPLSAPLLPPYWSAAVSLMSPAISDITYSGKDVKPEGSLMYCDSEISCQAAKEDGIILIFTIQ